jgi:tripartite-type tricarboxylate transporter receptor subunit TctC
MLTRRQFTLAAVASAAAAAMPTSLQLMMPAGAAARPLTIIVPFSKSGPTDQFARLISAPLAKALGQNVRIENITGDWGMTGAVITAHANADGHTLIMGQLATHAALPVLTKRYDAMADFTPVGLAGVSPMVVMVRRDLPFNSLSALR